MARAKITPDTDATCESPLPQGAVRQDIETSLREREAQLRLALEAAQTGIWLWDIATERVTWSEECYHIHGLTREEFDCTRDAFARLVHPKDIADVWKAVRYAIDHGTKYHHEFRIIRPDGTIRWVANAGRVAYDATGRPTHVTGTITDITERMQTQHALAESEARLRLALSASQTGIWEWDIRTGKVTRIGDCAAIHGIPDGDFDGTIDAFKQMIHPEDLPRVFQAVHQAVDSRTRYASEFRIVRPDGKIRWVADAGVVQCDADGEPVSMTGTITDITDRYEAQAALHRAKEEAEAASKVKNTFLAMISHELRTPLSPVLLAVSALLDERNLPADIQATLRLVLRNIEIEARLIDDLLDLSRSIGGKLVLAIGPVRFHEVIRAAIDVVRSEADSRGVTLHAQLSAASDAVDADGTRLQQAVWNILGNAVKFTPAGGRVDISTTLTPGGERIVVSVTDTGLGIAPADLERIFDPFEQAAGNSSRQLGGLGLGLAISRSIIEAHGGTLTATSAGADHGATFTITLPVRP